jgi:hypothetical protein
MKITKRQLKRIIKEELSGFLGEDSEDMDPELEQVLYVVQDHHVAGMTAEEALSAAKRSEEERKGWAGSLVSDYVNTHGETGLLAAMEAEMAKHKHLY